MLQTAADRSPKIMIVAGEASGDLHGSNLIAAAAEYQPHLQFFGVGGDKMRRCRMQNTFPF